MNLSWPYVGKVNATPEERAERVLNQIFGRNMWSECAKFSIAAEIRDGAATVNPELRAPSSELVAEVRRDEHFLACTQCNNSQVDGSRWTPCVRGMQLRANATQKVLEGDAIAKSAARCPNCGEVK